MCFSICFLWRLRTPRASLSHSLHFLFKLANEYSIFQNFRHIVICGKSACSEMALNGSIMDLISCDTLSEIKSMHLDETEKINTRTRMNCFTSLLCSSYSCYTLYLVLCTFSSNLLQRGKHTNCNTEHSIQAYKSPFFCWPRLSAEAVQAPSLDRF